MNKSFCAWMGALLLLGPLHLGAASSMDSTAGLKAPDLPKAEDVKDVPDSGDAASQDGKADVAVPDGEPEVKAESVKVTQAKPGHFRWGNFFLGALGGAVIIGTGAIISGATNNAAGGQLDGAKVAIWTGSGALGGGILSMLLGATSPLPATPPDMSLLPLPKGTELAWSLRF
jgi:hypothetical protein